MQVHFACAYCAWTFDGLLAEGRIESENHRTLEHPEIPPFKRRRHRTMMRPMWRTELSEEEQEEVNVDRRRRAMLHGVELTDDQ